MTPLTPLVASAAAGAAAAWSSCATCWGQRRILEDRNGEGLVPLCCPACLGLGEVAHVT